MRFLAEFLNAIGRRFECYGHATVARAMYAAATKLAPAWSVPWYNRGLIAKQARQWQDSLELNLRAAELDPKNEPAWWNLGIAATALGDWVNARRAWSGYGITVPSGEGPLEMNLGAVPIRVDPNGTPEVVWCSRLDPARVRIANVPFPESGRACRDILLTDGAPQGYREFRGQQVPVFNEIEVLCFSELSTFAVSVFAPNAEAIHSLAVLAEYSGLPMEDWSSSVDMLCKKCGEGLPHSHALEPKSPEWKSTRLVGIAATSIEHVESLVKAWLDADPARTVATIECALRR